MIFLTKHESQAAYDAVKDNLAKPQVALTLDNNTVHYQPYVAPDPSGSSLPVGESSFRIVAEKPLTRGKAACKVMFVLAQTHVRVYSNVCLPWLKSKDTPELWCKATAGLRHTYGTVLGKHSRH